MNTIVNKNGILHGYNTDYSAAKSVLSALRGTLLIVGIGGVVRAITVAAKELQLSATVTGRDATKALAFAARYDIPTLPWQQRDRFTADALISATPVGRCRSRSHSIGGVASMARNMATSNGTTMALAALRPAMMMTSEARISKMRTPLAD